VVERVAQFPRGAAVTAEGLEQHLHETFADLRACEPVSWVPALDAWVVTSRSLAVEVMRDAATFTVDDPRFSTAQVLGPSMLSLDGPAHGRHRDPFADAFRLPEVRRTFTSAVTDLARELVTELQPAGHAELRRELAGPLAARVMALALDLLDADATTLLAWYREIVAAVSAIAGGETRAVRPESAVDALGLAVVRTIDAGHGVLADARAALTADEVVANTGVLLFGGIETTEGMTTNLFAHLLAEPELWDAVDADRALIPNAIEESLRLEPSVVRVDRFATHDTRLGEADIERGDFVIVMISAANRDPSAFADPDRFDIRRENAKQHLTFAHGPHTCLGMHLARLEANAAVTAALDLLPRLRHDAAAPPPVATGTVFRKPDRLDMVWDPGR
jgi:cytochrome P450